MADTNETSIDLSMLKRGAHLDLEYLTLVTEHADLLNLSNQLRTTHSPEVTNALIRQVTCRKELFTAKLQSQANQLGAEQCDLFFSEDDSYDLRVGKHLLCAVERLNF